MKLDSVKIRHINIDFGEDLINMLTIRIVEGQKKIEYRFYDMLEFTQESNNHKKNELVLNQSNDWSNKYIKYYNSEKVSAKISDLVYNHYIFNIDGYTFNILAEGYVVEDDFFEIFREQEAIKKIIS